MHNFRLVYLNGEFLPPSQARVSVFDRGFIFGDGVYEVIPVFGKRLFRLPHHLARLDRSLAEIRLANPLSAARTANQKAPVSASRSPAHHAVSRAIGRPAMGD